MFRDKSTQHSQREFELLHKRIARLKSLALTYKRLEVTHNRLLVLSNLATTASSSAEFYAGIYSSIKALLPTDNFFVALLNSKSNRLEIPFFLDEKETPPVEGFHNKHISDKLLNGLTGYVLKTGKTLLCDEEKFTQLIFNKQITSLGAQCHHWLGVPIKENNDVVGALVIQSHSKDINFTKREIELLNFVSHQISNVIKRIKHQEQRTKELSVANNKLKQKVHERRRAEQLKKSLFEIAKLATSSIETTTFYSEIHRVVNHLISAKNCYVALLNEQCSMINFPFYVNQNNGSPPNSRQSCDGLTKHIIKNGKPLLLQNSDIQSLIDSDEIASQSPELNDTTKINQWIGIPLFIHGQVRGALTIYSTDKTHRYQQNDLDLLTFVSQHISSVIERKLSAESLISSDEQLEIKVVERTQALTLLNQDLEQQIENRRKIEQKLVHDANHDTLTGLPNRGMFMERLSQAVKHTRRHKPDRFALMFIDLDRFKLINDTLGHLEGDRFLIETSKRLKLCIRENDTLGRIGGDEFVILLDRINDVQDAKEVAKRVLIGLAEPYKLANQQFKSGASIGIAFSHYKADTSESLLRDADAAMYQAKSNGKGCYVIFDDKSHKQFNNDIKLEQELSNAISTNSLLISYLPIQDLHTGKTCALEPRLYWNHPYLGKIKQAKLSNIAEQCNLTTELDIFLLENLNNEYYQLQEMSLNRLPIHLNISGQHLKHKHTLRLLKNKLKQSHFKSEQLWLFFDEQGYIFDTNNHIYAFEQLTKLNVNLALSGYGNAHSALSSLTFLPLQGLKLDPSYADHLDSEQHIKLLNAYFLTAQALELSVFVDGISSEKQQRTLQKMGFDQGQGKSLGKVLRFKEASALIDA